MFVATTLPVHGDPSKPREASGALIIRFRGDSNEVTRCRLISDSALKQIERVIENDWRIAGRGR